METPSTLPESDHALQSCQRILSDIQQMEPSFGGAAGRTCRRWSNIRYVRLSGSGNVVYDLRYVDAKGVDFVATNVENRLNYADTLFDLQMDPDADSDLDILHAVNK